jgi:hypothetical protein
VHAVAHLSEVLEIALQHAVTGQPARVAREGKSGVAATVN